VLGEAGGAVEWVFGWVGGVAGCGWGVVGGVGGFVGGWGGGGWWSEAEELVVGVGGSSWVMGGVGP